MVEENKQIILPCPRKISLNKHYDERVYTLQLCTYIVHTVKINQDINSATFYSRLYYLNKKLGLVFELKYCKSFGYVF